MIAYIHPHKQTKERPTQQWAAFDESGLALGYAHNLDKLVEWLKAEGYEITHKANFRCNRPDIYGEN